MTDRDDRALLCVLLDNAVYTAADLTRELGWPPARTDAAVSRLRDVGLVQQQGGAVVATRAARRFDELGV